MPQSLAVCLTTIVNRHDSIVAKEIIRVLFNKNFNIDEFGTSVSSICNREMTMNGTVDYFFKEHGHYQ